MFDHRRLAAALESVSSVPAESSPPIAPAGGSDGTVLANPNTKGRSTDPRRRILDALIATVARRGYDRTTLERVLHLAQVPAPVFDEHFENKEDCLLQALDELIGRLECIVLERAHRPAPWPERIRL
ncbi:MAG: TetR/AcrR family transcriptional regulator, partial [Solirubrobacteraceae bacterium]